MYIADGANIRVVSDSGYISTMIGSQGQPTHWTPMSCDKPVPIDQVGIKVIDCIIIDLFLIKFVNIISNSMFSGEAPLAYSSCN